MDRRRKVELFEQIRRDYRDVGTVVGVAKKLGVHRRMVRDDVDHDGPSRRLAASRARFRHDVFIGRTPPRQGAVPAAEEP